MGIYFLPASNGSLEGFITDPCVTCGWVGKGSLRQYVQTLDRQHEEFHAARETERELRSLKPAQVRARAIRAIEYADTTQTREAYRAAEEASRAAERRTSGPRLADFIHETERMMAAADRLAD